MNKPLHFMHVFPNFGPGGMELRVTRIINGMGLAVRHTILPLLGNHDAGKFIDRDIPVNYLTPPVERNVLSYIRAIRRILRAYRPDLLLTYNWGSLDAVLSAWTTDFRPIVHHECGFGSEESLRLKTRRVLARRLLLRQVFGVAVTSKALREIAVEQFKIPANKVHWICTGVDAERFRPGLPRLWRRQAGVGEEELLFGFVGALRPEKNLGLILRAFAAAGIPKSKLALVGDGVERSRLEQAAREEGIAERVLFPGRVSDPAAYLAALDVFLLSSSTEQTSNALLEAMACGLPAVSTDVGDSGELLGNTGLPAVVPSGDLQAFTDALTLLARDPTLRARLGAANRRRCMERYPLERMVREYEALYQAACRDQSRRVHLYS